MENPITVETTVNAPMEKVWEAWIEPEHITHWAFASSDWEAPTAENDLQVGGKFTTRMSAKDKSAGFDFTGTYTDVKENELIEYDMDGDDHRHVKVEFKEEPEGMSAEASAKEGVKITVIFDPENENPIEMQKDGWQAISDNFKKYVESI